MPEQPERPVHSDTAADAAAADQSEVRRRSYAANRRAKATRNGARWVLAIAILQLILGVFVGLKHQKEADAALQNLSTMEATEVLKLDGGEETTVGELRQAVERETVQMFAVPIGLGVVFLGLYFWARKSPIPALATALGLFVTAHAVEAVVDPAAIVRGIIVKVFCVVGLLNGIRSALHQRTSDLAQDAAGQPSA
ncbi:MAG TPA: hypothetical protein VFD82_11085 [Planctomycetota bacterium]|nr:hypothetical protein [Planctomycetota bacterium]